MRAIKFIINKANAAFNTVISSTATDNIINTTNNREEILNEINE